jgi:hypothetical protein
MYVSAAQHSPHCTPHPQPLSKGLWSLSPSIRSRLAPTRTSGTFQPGTPPTSLGYTQLLERTRSAQGLCDQLSCFLVRNPQGPGDYRLFHPTMVIPNGTRKGIPW